MPQQQQQKIKSKKEYLEWVRQQQLKSHNQWSSHILDSTANWKAAMLTINPNKNHSIISFVTDALARRLDRLDSFYPLYQSRLPYC